MLLSLNYISSKALKFCSCCNNYDLDFKVSTLKVCKCQYRFKHKLCFNKHQA